MQQADGEHRTAAQPVRECAGRQQQAGERQRVSVDHPLQVEKLASRSVAIAGNATPIVDSGFAVRRHDVAVRPRDVV